MAMLSKLKALAAGISYTEEALVDLAGLLVLSQRRPHVELSPADQTVVLDLLERVGLPRDVDPETFNQRIIAYFETHPLPRELVKLAQDLAMEVATSQGNVHASQDLLANRTKFQANEKAQPGSVGAGPLARFVLSKGDGES